MPRLPFKRWPHDAGTNLSIRQIRAMYRDGYAGCEYRPDKIKAADEEFADHIEGQGNWSHSKGEDAAYSGGIVGSGEGKLTVLFPYIEQLYPGSLPGPAQARGDCVSHSQALANLTTIALDVGKADEITGIIEGAPDVSPDGCRAGVVSSCYLYWFRGSSGDGWQCSIAAKVSTQSGVMLCKMYDLVDLDLTHYSGHLAGLYGRRSPPERVEALGRQHLIRTSTKVSGYEQLRDFCSNGYGISTCGSQSWSSTRDECGVSKRTRQGWSHALGLLGVDDRAATRRRYQTRGLCLLANSWGKGWNSGGRTILNTSIDIPAGCFWTKYEDMEDRSCYAMSSAQGWPSKTLPAIMGGW